VDGTRSLRTWLAVSALTATLVAPVARAHEQNPESAEQRAPVVVKVSDGFHWKDAAVGAVAALGVVTIAVGGVVVVRDRPGTPPTARGSDT
jgi:hypothetical protein